MVCAYVPEGNRRALASGLSPVQRHNQTITAFCTNMHVYRVHCDKADVEHWNITQRCNKYCYPARNLYIIILHVYASNHLQYTYTYCIVNGCILLIINLLLGWGQLKQKSKLVI